MRSLITVYIHHFHQRWQRCISLIILLTTSGILYVLIPTTRIPVLLLALAVLIWERIRIASGLHTLTMHIASGQPLSKIEVQEDALGALCHAVNNVLQQQRLYHHTQALLPTLPTRATATLCRTHVPDEGISHTVTILVVGYTRATPRQPAATDQHIQALRNLSAVIQEQIETHHALLERYGDLFLMAFGAFDTIPLTTTNRQALQTAQALRQTWNSNSPRGGLTFSLANGSALALVLPGLGYTMIGAPLQQALHIHQIALAHPSYSLLCSEECYVTLRHTIDTAWIVLPPRVLSPDQCDQAVYACWHR